MFFSFFLFSFDEAFCIRLVCNLEFTDVTLLFSAMRKILANLYVCSIQRNQKTPTECSFRRKLNVEVIYWRGSLVEYF